LEVHCKEYTAHDHLEANKILMGICGKNTDHHLLLAKTPFQLGRRGAVPESKKA